MQIHNFLCDLLVSIKILIDQYLFSNNPGFIQSYEFNLGNRSFQLGKEPSSSYSLPACIVNINDDNINFGGRRTDLIMQNALPNINKIPVIYNENKNVIIEVHEEQTQVPFTISFNCESQLQAKEVAYIIKRFLPLQKNLNIFSFLSYLELPHNLLLDVLNFDIPFDTIQNLYTKLNYNTGKPEYCFSLEHNPLIRLDSINTSVQDSTASTFQVQIDLTYTIPFPQYLIISKINFIETINFSFNIEKHPVVTIPFSKYYIGIEPSYKIDRTLLIQSENTRFPDSVLISKTETQVFLSIKFDLNDFVINNNIYKYRFSKNIFNIRTPVIQEPAMYYEEENRAVFIFEIDTYNDLLKPEANSPLFIDFYYDITS